MVPAMLAITLAWATPQLLAGWVVPQPLVLSPRSAPRARFAIAFAEDDSAEAPTLEILPTGLRYVETNAGSGGVPAPGDVIKVRYTGSILSDGRRVAFPSAKDTLVFVRGQVSAGSSVPCEARVAAQPPCSSQAPVKVWDGAVEGLRVGGSRRVLVPPSSDFQPQQSGPGVIEAGETIRLDLQLECIVTGPMALYTKAASRLKYKLTPFSIIFLLSLVPYFLPNSLTPTLWRGGPQDGLIAQILEAAAPPQAFDDEGNFEDIGF
jgi:hypothetical protein